MRLASGLAAGVITVGLASAAVAQDESYIRIEAKRGGAAQEAVARWQTAFPDVVTWSLGNGMTAIALGPVDAQAAADRLTRLKAEGTVPADSFVATPAPGAVVTATADNTAVTENDATPAIPADTPSAQQKPGASASTAALMNAASDADTEGTGEAAPAEAAADPDSYQIQLQATQGEASARRLLAQWREQFPQAGLWRLPGGWFAIALPAETQAEAESLRTALIGERRIPADAFLAAADRMGTLVEAPTALPASADDNTVTAALAPDAQPIEPVVEEAETGTDEAEATAPTVDEGPSDTAASVGTESRHEDEAAPAEDAADAEGHDDQAESEEEAEAEPATQEPSTEATPAADAADEDRPTQPSARDVQGSEPPVTDDTPPDTTTPEAATANQDQQTAAATPDPAGTGATGADMAKPAMVKPAPPAVMPPIKAVQEALAWAGYYDGEIDGLSGPATREAIEREIAAVSPGADLAEAMVNLLARREAWRSDLGLWAMRDAATAITLTAPTSRLAFDRVEDGMAIYGPKDGSGAALILVAREGDPKTLAEFAGFVTALGWVPNPQRTDERGRHVALDGQNDDHYGQAQLWLKDGVMQGFILIWPASDADNARRLAIEATSSFVRDASAALPGAASPTSPTSAGTPAGAG